MSIESLQAISVGTDRLPGVAKLIAMSHESPMDALTALPWEIGVDTTRPPKLAAHSWLEGTPALEKLTQAQRDELLWLEVARDVSLFIHLEQILPVLYMGYVQQHSESMSPEMVEYLMIFSKEEIVHTMVFRRYMALAKLPIFWDHVVPPAALAGLAKLPPAGGVIYTLIVEWAAELGAMHSTQDDTIDPLTRELFRRHHVDESRHLAFGRWVAEDFLAKAPPPLAQAIRDMVKGVVAQVIPLYTFDPLIAKYSSFDYPVANQPDAIEAIRASASNALLNQRRFAPLTAWLKKWDLA